MKSAITFRRTGPAGPALVLVALALAASPAVSQDATVSDYTIRRDRVTRTAMTVLASWSAVNMVAGTALSFAADDPQTAAFHQMNAGWNIVNAALAVPSLLGANARLADPPAESLSEALVAQNRMEDILLFNAGIDLAYMASGLYMIERSRRGEPNADQLAGFGRSLIVQGGFLFAFDLVVYLVQRGTGRELAALADGR